MAVFARVLTRLENHVYGDGKSGYTSSSSSASHLSYRGIAEELANEERLNELHWDERAGIYADYGLHTDDVTLRKPPLPPNAHPNDPPVSRPSMNQ